MSEQAIPERSWDRWPNEPPNWFERFDRYYRSLGPGRTLTAAYQIHYKDIHGKLPSRAGVIDSWNEESKKWEWKTRAEAWDAKVRQEMLRAEEEELVEMARRHTQSAQAIQALALEKILDDGFKDSATALRGWKQGVQVEKSARGVPDHIAEVAELDDDELNEQLAKAIQRAGGVRRDESETEGEPSSEA